MKLFVVAAILGLCSAGRLDNSYLPPRGNQGSGAQALAGSGFNQNQYSSSGSGFSGSSYSGGSNYNGGSNFNGGSSFSGSTRDNSKDAKAQILKLNSEVNTDSFSYEYETSNGIRADARGVATNGVQSQGSFSYKGDDGQEYSITYTADENGYQPRGDFLPTPPPIPAEILKALEQNARDEAAGIVDDGQYRGEGAGHGAGQSGGQSYSSNGGYSQGGHSQGSHSQGGHSQGGHSQGGYSQAGHSQSSFSGQSSFQGSSNFGNKGFQGRPSAPSRGSGNGNFNPQSGYHY